MEKIFSLNGDLVRFVLKHQAFHCRYLPEGKSPGRGLGGRALQGRQEMGFKVELLESQVRSMSLSREGIVLHKPEKP